MTENHSAHNDDAHAYGDNIQAFYPKGVHWDIDIPHIDIPRILDEAIVKYSDRPAIDFMGRKISYQNLGKYIAQTAKGLQEMGIKKGDKIGLFMPNTPYYPIFFFAALKIGATVVNYSPLYTESELRTQIEDSGTETMVTLDLKDFHDKTHALQREGCVKKMVVCPLGEMLSPIKKTAFEILQHKNIASAPDSNCPNIALSSSSPLYSKTQYTNFHRLIQNDGYFQSIAVDPENIAVLQYTGGTTGVPKGAMLSHFNLVANAHQIEEFFAEHQDRESHDSILKPGKDVVLASIPYFHVFGMMVSMISSLKLGAQLIILPNPRDIPATLKAIHKNKPNVFPAVPRLLQAIAENPKTAKYDLSSLHAVISGGAALTHGVKCQFEQAVERDNIILQGYGLSETSPVVTSNPPEGPIKSDAVGLPYPRTEIRIAGPSDPSKTLKMGEVGEICIRGPQVMQGYYNKPEETELVLTKDGWLLTGDLGCLDDDFYLRIVDRKKRMIIVNGHNAYPTQIENAISKHPAIAEVCVIGLPDERSGEAAKAFIRLHPEQTLNENDLQAFLQKDLNKLDIPKFYEFRDEELPKTSVGKTDFKALEREELEKRGTIKGYENPPQLKP